MISSTEWAFLDNFLKGKSPPSLQAGHVNAVYSGNAYEALM